MEHKDEIIDSLQAQLASQAECGQGWMDAYYAQTSRLLRAQAALENIADTASSGQIIRMAKAALAEIEESIKEQEAL